MAKCICVLVLVSVYLTFAHVAATEAARSYFYYMSSDAAVASDEVTEVNVTVVYKQSLDYVRTASSEE